MAEPEEVMKLRVYLKMVSNMEELLNIQSTFDSYFERYGGEGRYILKTNMEKVSGFGSLKKLTVEVFYSAPYNAHAPHCEARFECKGKEDADIYSEASDLLFEFYMEHGKDRIK